MIGEAGRRDKKLFNGLLTLPCSQEGHGTFPAEVAGRRQVDGEYSGRKEGAFPVSQPLLGRVRPGTQEKKPGRARLRKDLSGANSFFSEEKDGVTTRTRTWPASFVGDGVSGQREPGLWRPHQGHVHAWVLLHVAICVTVMVWIRSVSS
jgi:hypothetical protein